MSLAWKVNIVSLVGGLNSCTHRSKKRGDGSAWLGGNVKILSKLQLPMKSEFLYLLCCALIVCVGPEDIMYRC